MTNAIDSTVAIGDSVLGATGAIPGWSNVLSGANAVTQASAAVYDGYNGDRDGAINHGVQAAYGAVGASPLVGNVVSAIDGGVSAVGAVNRIGQTVAGNDPNAYPGGIADILGGMAVAGTNAVFGPADQSNMTGDHRVEQTISSPMALLTAGGGYVKHLFGSGAADQGVGSAGPTSGARGPHGEANGWAQQAGDWMNQAPGNFMREMDRGIRRTQGVPGF